MRRLRTASIVLIVLVLIVSAGAAVVLGTDVLKTDRHTGESALKAVLTPSMKPEPSLTQSPSPTPSPTTVPSKPKYIFYIIGDGMGFSHLDLGAVYEKVRNEDSSYAPYWERFQLQKSLEGGIESAKGGTMLATGHDGEQSKIAVTSDGEPLYTILDRARDAGFLTGVISNSYIMDATPAAFLAHVTYRGKYADIVSQVAQSDVNYVSSGGLNYFLDDSLKEEFGKYDIRRMKYAYQGEGDILSHARAAGYDVYSAEEAADFLYGDSISGFEKDKLLLLFVSKNMSYRWNKYGSRRKRYEVDEPDLEDMTRVGISMLSKDDDGFFFVIEEALIDKASHNNELEYIATEMHALNETLEAVFEFYSEHPYETLIILAADHETGAFTSDKGFADMLTKLPDINFHQEPEELYGFLEDEWNLSVSLDRLRDRREAALLNLWEGDEKNYTMMHAYIASELCKANGIDVTSKYHSRQEVPFFAMGVKSDLFYKCESISDIAPLICEIMGWEALPEVRK